MGISTLLLNASKNQTSPMVDAYSAKPIYIQAVVSGGTLTAGTLKSETSLDGVHFDQNTYTVNMTYTDIANSKIISVATGWPVARFVIASLAFNYGKAQTGVGLSDLTIAGTYTPTTAHTYVIKITTADTTDKWAYSKDGGAFSAEAAMVAGPVVVVDGITVAFGAKTGHVLGDYWTITPAAISVYMSK